MKRRREEGREKERREREETLLSLPFDLLESIFMMPMLMQLCILVPVNHLHAEVRRDEKRKSVKKLFHVPLDREM